MLSCVNRSWLDMRERHEALDVKPTFALPIRPLSLDVRR
jgi:hypothetical protein